MELIHNTIFKIIEGPDTGFYRVLLDEIQIGEICAVRLDPPTEGDEVGARGGRKKTGCAKRKVLQLPMLGKLIWFEREDLQHLYDNHQLVTIEIKPEGVLLEPLPEKDKELFDFRCSVMRDFLDFDVLREHIVGYRSIQQLVSISKNRTKASPATVRKLFSLLCRIGFSELSLRPRLDRCGAPGTPRNCDPGGRKKAGAKTIKQKIATAYGEELSPEQPGMSTAWREMILAADAGIPVPKPLMPQRCNMIISSSFIQRYQQENGKLVPLEPKLGEYPNQSQIRRVLETDLPRLENLLKKTTSGHFVRNKRGMVGRSWQGVSGPGHTWAIDSTIGDIYLRSSINRNWIIGRPVVYIIVDVWSTAVVGFYVCLTGPSWDMAKVALFSAAADQNLIANLWGYPPILSLSPAPTMCAALMCDRGEYLSKAASQTGARLIPCLSYAPPYRPELKGCVEVLHRIEKEQQYFFVPGAIDQRRQEYELRRFDMNEAVLTIREYTHLLYTIFSKYNLSADRTNRVDAHMSAAGVFPSPAGLWRWGHEVGIGVRRSIAQEELVKTLLPESEARISRRGIMHGGLLYESEVANEQQWTAYARNFGGWDIPINSYPGSSSKIWTPNPAGQGQLELSLSDYANASPELTQEELVDAFAVAQSKRAHVAHTRNLVAISAIDRIKEIVNQAKKLTSEALQDDRGPIPNLTDARMIETYAATNTQPSLRPAKISTSSPENSDAMDAHLEMMKSILAAENYMEGVGND